MGGQHFKPLLGNEIDPTNMSVTTKSIKIRALVVQLSGEVNISIDIFFSLLY